MNTLHCRTTIVGLMAVLALVVGMAGCGGAAVEPAATETVLAEGETVCDLEILGEREDVGVLRDEPGLGEVLRGHLIWGDMNCPGAFENARVVALQDIGDAIWVGYAEIIPDEGGVWKGFCDNTGAVIGRCVYEGGGINEGKRLETEMNWDTMAMSYRTIQLPEASTTADPAATETILAEGETICEATVLDETSEATIEREETDLGRVVRGHLLWGDMNCPDSFGKARLVTVQDFWDFDQSGEAGVWVAYNEFIPEEDGVWRGNCDNSGPISRCVLEGDGIYKGQRLETELIFATMKQDYRIIQVAEE